MDLHTLKPNTASKSRKRVGRGGKRGTYSGKGMKGQRARSGAKISPLFAGGSASLMGQGSQIIHKLRGQGNTPQRSPKSHKVVNISTLDLKFESGETVSPETLIERGIVTSRVTSIKILGKGTSEKKFVFEGVDVSQAVRETYSA